MGVDERGVLSFQGGETAALQRLKEYFWDRDRLKIYKQTRNGMVGSDYSSKFSPWLAHGCISPRKIFHEVRRYEKETGIADKNTYWMIFELTFRDYFRFYTKHYGSAVFKKGGPKMSDGKTLNQSVGWDQNIEKFMKWCAGTTNNPMIDANMRELKQTGFMSNRGRQIVASYLTRDMGLDWRMGAMYFEYALIDHDVSQNWGNWTYAAGVGSDPREDRYFNISKQTKNYDKDLEFVRLWVPELQDKPSQTIFSMCSHGTRQRSHSYSNS